MNQQNIDYVLRSVEQRDIRFVRLWFVDILGRLKNFAISPEDLEVAFEEGIGFDGSAIEGFATPEEADMLAFPDASTFQILPWRPSHNGVARVFCDVCTPDRKPFAGDPRDALRRMFRKAEKAGYLLNVGAELEYYYFPDEHTPEPLDNVGYFDLSVSDAARDLRRNTVLTLEKMSVPVEYTFHAAGRSQHGMSLRHAEALSMSDAITTAKLIIKQQAYESGCHASFMPKPLAGEDGSAMFLHQSLFDHDGNNVFWGEADEKYHLSDIAKHYMAGILAHAREISAITNPTVNSYKRITTGGDSVPQYATWGLRNRASMVRIPVYKPGKQLSTRIELRSPDPMANPYLVNAVTLAAGLDGIERKLELPPEATAETLKLNDRQMLEAGYTPLPRSLKEALDVFEDSQFMKDALGEHIHSFFLKKKRDEWHKFESTITEWEIKHYLANS
ncbi:MULTISPECIES: glutamine synthetase family protein [unclassified Collinsella]|jgi:glutamine synthetase|uniref:glutamine synthetase family protein n=1 Tax=unclassified Collinsella TaxID=2637548 RepID=UPI000E4B0EFA|nr:MULTISPECIES: glutamine synthetase family protein [unclassified Collinsella]RGT46836.1 glutamine synthetase [Collinsella sp. AF18-8LB]RGT51185.1 glutamine synthetase [Collinsella sp. AF18-8]RGT66678.1 glutamine synthetase [Collinsella sp. AF18-33LB]RHE50622.1 glutamine synthetase [Collinsella sp. AM28-11LB]RHN20703.1 glutamine synthetase [Collinsella sp. AF31-11]